jgi:hypothetical protein
MSLDSLMVVLPVGGGGQSEQVLVCPLLSVLKIDLTSGRNNNQTRLYSSCPSFLNNHRDHREQSRKKMICKQ